MKLRSSMEVEIDPLVFLKIFTPGRTDAYGWNKSTIREPLGELQIQQHLKGIGRLGIILLSPDGKCKWAVGDLDNLSVAAVKEITQTARIWGLILYVERSRSKGYHLWLFFTDWVPAAKARAVLHGIIKAAGWGEHRIEVFPKQSHPGPDGLGNFLYMPLHGDSVKEGRTLFINISEDQWPPYPDQAGFLRSAGRTSEEYLDRLIQQHRLTVEKVTATQMTDDPINDTGGTPTRVTTLPLPPCALKVYTEGVTSPGRSDWAHFLARHFRRRGLPEEATLLMLRDWNQKNRPEPLSEDKLAKMVRNTYAKQYTALGCEYLAGAKDICGDQCPVKVKEEQHRTQTASLVISAREFLGRPRSEQPKLIPRLGGRRGGKLGLFGPGGSGKSYTFLNISICAAEGRPLLGYEEWTVAAPLRVAFLSLEDPASEQLDRLKLLLPFYGLEDPPEGLYLFDRDLEEEGFVLAGSRGALNERAFNRLDQCLGDLKIDLLLVEPKRYLVEVDENSSTENAPWHRRLQDLLIRHGTLAFVGHHAGWDRDGKIHARGTTAFRDWVDGMIQQREDQIQGKPGFQLKCDKMNFAPQWEPLSVLFDPATGGMKAVDETSGKLPPSLLRACFEENRGNIEGPVEEVRTRVAEYAKCSTATARRAIEAAKEEGWLRSLGRGKGIGLSAHGGVEG